MVITLKKWKKISKVLDIFFIYDIINNQGKGSETFFIIRYKL